MKNIKSLTIALMLCASGVAASLAAVTTADAASALHSPIHRGRVKPRKTPRPRHTPRVRLTPRATEVENDNDNDDNRVTVVAPPARARARR